MIRLVMSVALIVIGSAILLLPKGRMRLADHRFYRGGRSDPFYWLMGDQEYNPIRALKIAVVVTSVLGVILLWLM